jgi:hypothetical protein
MSQSDHPIDQPSPGLRQAFQATPDLRSPDDLHICPDCSSGLVYPIDWAPVDMRHWRVELRCPECNWERAGLYEQDVLDRFDAILDAGTESLLDDLRLLQRSNMEDELARFTSALERDLITPEDF